eukprot:770611-Pelagomonas_calceolata.AAC.1
MGIWRVTGSTRLENLAVRSITVFHSTSSGNKLVCILNRMGMKFPSKFIGSLMVQSNVSKGPLGAGLTSIDIGSAICLAFHAIHILDHSCDWHNVQDEEHVILGCPPQGLSNLRIQFQHP